MKVAIAHDWLTGMGGAEVVVAAIGDVYKDAPIYTTVYNPDNVSEFFRQRDIRTSFLQKGRKAVKNHHKYFPYMPVAWEQFDFSGYDAVISSSSSCAKGLVTSPDTMHICYCHTPMRYAWEFYNEYKAEWDLSFLKKKLLPYFMNYMRVWDAVSADRADYFIANSVNVAKRIRKHYRRESTVIHAPVQSKYYTNLSDINEEYFLVVSRLVSYKKIDLAVQAFNEMKLPLVVIGDGPQFEQLRKSAGPSVTMLGRQPDEVVMEYFSKCRALIYPGEEDFGITPVEVQASGRPVIAYGRGGALETVADGRTGVLFGEQTVRSLIGAVERFGGMTFERAVITENAKPFSEDIFKQKIKDFVEEKYAEFKAAYI
jgi:glycosyltransferase involved in cell wall biosynthesis